jgi:WD repeat-containing protein 35
LLEFEKKDCWNIMWSEDNPLHFCFMERSRLYTVKGIEADEPVTTESFICCFSNLKVTCAMLDEIIKAEGNMKSSEIIIEFETKLLKEVKDMINKQGVKEAFTLVEGSPHEMLWKLIAQKALDEGDFVTAEKAFLKNEDYQGLQLLKRI